MLRRPQWFHVARALGVGMIVYGVGFDDSPERGTIILGGIGLAFGDRVLRSDESATPPSRKRDDHDKE